LFVFWKNWKQENLLFRFTDLYASYNFFLIFDPSPPWKTLMSFMDDPKDDGQKSSLPHRYSLAVLFRHFISGHSLVASD
jgi:hypothetical protein